MGKDGEPIRASAYRPAHDDYGRVLQGGLHAERRRSAPAAKPQGTAAAIGKVIAAEPGQDRARHWRSAVERGRPATSCIAGPVYDVLNGEERGVAADWSLRMFQYRSRPSREARRRRPRTTRK